MFKVHTIKFSTRIVGHLSFPSIFKNIIMYYTATEILHSWIRFNSFQSVIPDCLKRMTCHPEFPSDDGLPSRIAWQWWFLILLCHPKLSENGDLPPWIVRWWWLTTLDCPTTMTCHHRLLGDDGIINSSPLSCRSSPSLIKWFKLISFHILISILKTLIPKSYLIVNIIRFLSDTYIHFGIYLNIQFQLFQVTLLTIHSLL